jgi:diguanylate cyclase (GGDEF)-like protein
MKNDKTYLYLFSVFLMTIVVCLYLLFTIQTYPYNYLYFILTCFLLLFSFIRGLNQALALSLFFVFGHGTWILVQIYILKTLSETGVNDVIWLLFFPLTAVLAGLTGGHLQELIKRYRLLEMNYSEFVMIDETTGFPNLRRFRMDLEEEVNRSVRYNRAMVLLLVEIKYFSQLNKEFGEKNTEQLLQDLAQGISGAMRDVDKKAYLSDGVFALILPETTMMSIDIICSRLRESLRSNQIVKSKQRKSINIDLRFGMASSPEESNQSEEIYQKAKEKLEKYVE